MPFHGLLYVTAVPVDADDYSYCRMLVYPVPGVAFFIYTITKELYSWNYIYYGLPTAAVLYVIFLVFLKKNQSPKWFMAFTCLGVVNGLMYTYVLIGILMDLLSTFGVLLNLEKAYLGLTILAVGNALPDALTTVALVKEGKGNMAISGAYSGQLFGLLVGFGISMLKTTLLKGPQDFNLWKHMGDNVLTLIVLGTVFVTLGFTFIFGIVNKFVMNKPFGTVLMIIYGCFIISTTGLAIVTSVATY